MRPREAWATVRGTAVARRGAILGGGYDEREGESEIEEIGRSMEDAGSAEISDIERAIARVELAEDVAGSCPSRRLSSDVGPTRERNAVCGPTCARVVRDVRDRLNRGLMVMQREGQLLLNEVR